MYVCIDVYSSFTPCRGDHQTKVAKKIGVFKS